MAWAEVVRQPLILETSRAKDLLGWRPAYTARDALDSTRSALGL